MALTSKWPHWDAYAATHVDIVMPGGYHAVLRAASADEVAAGAAGRWPFGSAPEAWIITACNPRSEPLDSADNDARHERLRTQLIEHGCEPHETVGRDADSEWLEPGFLVIGEVGPMIKDLAHEWEQNAVFHWTPEVLAIEGAHQPGRHAMPWVLIPREV